MRDTMPPPAQSGAAPAGAPAPAAAGEGEGGGGDPQQLITEIDKRLGALAASAANPEVQAAIEEVRDFFASKIDELMAKGGGKGPTAGPVSPEQGGGANVRPAGPA